MSSASPLDRRLRHARAVAVVGAPGGVIAASTSGVENQAAIAGIASVSTSTT
jgi:hypothetical protein